MRSTTQEKQTRNENKTCHDNEITVKDGKLKVINREVGLDSSVQHCQMNKNGKEEKEEEEEEVEDEEENRQTDRRQAINGK